MDISSILPQGKFSFFSCSHGCPPSCRRKPKKNSFCYCSHGCHPSCFSNIFFSPFYASHGCYRRPSCRRKVFWPFLFFLWMLSIHPVAETFFSIPLVIVPMDVVHPICNEINLLFGAMGQIICCTNWMSSFLSHTTFFLIT